MKSASQGYAEGYYARLLSWQERLHILDTLEQLALNTYYYAPKEDPLHRLNWREPYTAQWRDDFRLFCQQAKQRGIKVIAGVAPGLDFNFKDLPHGRDFKLLKDKCQMLLDEGADVASLLLDDIDTDFTLHCGPFRSEGQAHASLANALAEALDVANLSQDLASQSQLWVTPRIYADELIEDAPEYLAEFMHVLANQHTVLYCGSDVVAEVLDQCSAQSLLLKGQHELQHKVVYWDNLYANDYCPRRLFVGPWSQRHNIENVVLNPSGMVHTDCLLLELMVRQQQSISAASLHNATTELELCKAVMTRHGVPDAFFELLAFFNHPVFNTNALDQAEMPTPDKQVLLEAIEHCLWRWKSPLSREWYPYLFGLKHDLLSANLEHEALRIQKTQPRPLSDILLKVIKGSR